MRIGLIGAGMMGEGLGRNLLAHGHGLNVAAHRNRAPVEALVGLGAREASSPQAVADGADAVILCLTTAKVVEETVAALLPHLKPGQIVIDAGTTGVEATKALAHLLHGRGIRFADAPMTGGPEQAAKGELGVLCGADEETFALIEPVLACYATRVRRFGPPGAGQTAKLASNFIITGMIALVAEGFAAAHKARIDWRDLYEVMQNGSGNSGVLRKMLEPVLKGDFDGYKFSLANAHKDIGHYREMIEVLGLDSELAPAVHGVFARAIDGGHGGRNVSHLLDPAIDDVS